MKDGKRLLDDTSDPLRTALMRSTFLDGAKPGSKARVAKAIGIGGAGAAITTSSTAAGAVKTGASLVTWLGVATVVAAVGALGMWLVLQGHAGPAPAPASTNVTAARAPIAPSAAPPSAAPLPESERSGEKHVTADPPTVDVNSLPRAPSAQAAPSAAPPRAQSDDSTLPAELAALDDTRATLAAHDARGTLRKLDAYDHQFPAGRLREEAIVLRVEALTAAGDRVAAEALGKRFLASSPASPYAARVRRLIGAPPGDGPGNRP